MFFALFESLRSDQDEGRSFFIREPDLILQCSRLQDVAPLLAEVETAANRGYFAAGFLAYEAGFAFVPHMPPAAPSDFPLAWFALTKEPVRLAARELPSGFLSENQPAEITGLGLNMDLANYRSSIESIRNHIRNGETYQVNFTLRYRGNFTGSARSFYGQLRLKQSVSYAAYLETDEWIVLSLSPELFFRRQGERIEMRPMKGTAPRGRTRQEDEAQAKALRESIKERSENLMIVDMIRNDLGRISKTGTVEVERPLEVERYETLLQMTSTVKGRITPQTGLSEIFRAAFPSGSVTGAPKVRTMQLIHQLEKEPRGIYTGSIGFVTAEEAVFNVAIRTAWMDLARNRIEMGVGSGILYEADALHEYQECELKGKFFLEPPQDFQLLETILWDPDYGYARLNLHLDRLLESADYFLFSANRKTLESALMQQEDGWRRFGGRQRVRLLVDRYGRPHVEAMPVESLQEPFRIRFAGRRTDSSDPFLFHKTTRRSLYDDELRKAREHGFLDAIFCNEKNEVTEGAVSNLFIEKNGKYYTPPISCGLLAGTYRRCLLDSGELPVEEAVLYPQDLLHADAIYVSNAIRGWVRVTVDPA
jgi:para-aminobenzoate synthetase/4-amino-4-deoxychorismate lyase